MVFFDQLKEILASQEGMYCTELGRFHEAENNKDILRRQKKNQS